MTTEPKTPPTTKTDAEAPKKAPKKARKSGLPTPAEAAIAAAGKTKKEQS